MTLEIVWRNPVPPAKTECQVDAVTVDEWCTVCHPRHRENGGVRSLAWWCCLKLKRPTIVPGNGDGTLALPQPFAGGRYGIFRPVNGPLNDTLPEIWRVAGQTGQENEPTITQCTKRATLTSQGGPLSSDPVPSNTPSRTRRTGRAARNEWRSGSSCSNELAIVRM